MKQNEGGKATNAVDKGRRQADRRAGEAEEKLDHVKDRIEEVIGKTEGALHRK